MGNLFAGLGGLLGSQAAGQFGQQQQHMFTNCTFTADSDNAAMTISADSFGGTAPQMQIASGPETALAWLDRRVEEMRVKL